MAGPGRPCATLVDRSVDITYRCGSASCPLAAAVLAQASRARRARPEYIAGATSTSRRDSSRSAGRIPGAVQKDPMSGEARKKLAAAFDARETRAGPFASTVKRGLLPDDAGIQEKAAWYLCAREVLKTEDQGAQGLDKNQESRAQLIPLLRDGHPMTGRSIKEVKDRIELDPTRARPTTTSRPRQRKGDRDAAETPSGKRRTRSKSVPASALAQFLWLNAPGDGKRNCGRPTTSTRRTCRSTTRSRRCCSGRARAWRRNRSCGRPRNSKTSPPGSCCGLLPSHEAETTRGAPPDVVDGRAQHWARPKIRMAGIEYSRDGPSRRTTPSRSAYEPRNPEAELAMARRWRHRQVDEASCTRSRLAASPVGWRPTTSWAPSTRQETLRPPSPPSRRCGSSTRGAVPAQPRSPAASLHRKPGGPDLPRRAVGSQPQSPPRGSILAQRSSPSGSWPVPIRAEETRRGLP